MKKDLEFYDMAICTVCKSESLPHLTSKVTLIAKRYNKFSVPTLLRLTPLRTIVIRNVYSVLEMRVVGASVAK